MIRFAHAYNGKRWSFEGTLKLVKSESRWPGETENPSSVADPEFSKEGFQDSAREARGEKLVRSRPLPVQTGGKNEELKMISAFW